MKIGLITYHAAYNFGSVLQAYATQEIIRNIAGNCEIINYRSREQKRIYSLFVWNKGSKFVKSLVKNFLLIPEIKSRLRRAKIYEDLFQSKFCLSEECVTPEDVYAMWDKYDLIISGSDQIWNKHSNELIGVDWKYMYPYLLAGYNGKKVSYASSITNMSIDEINKIIKYIREFNSVSVREYESSVMLNREFGLDTINVLDPTFLLTREDWISRLKLEKIDDSYILYYALDSFKEIGKSLKKIKKYAKLRGRKIKIIAPMNIVRTSKDVEVLYDIGPVQFLSFILNADTVITDSYHGTILSVNLQRDIYSICKNNPSDFRKVDILNRIGLANRVIGDLDDLLNRTYKQIDYSKINAILDELRQKSLIYLKSSIGVSDGYNNNL